LTGSSPRLYR